ncbi:MAG: hypothetical protein V4632_19445 [Pseudomonadota bacterium]
MFTLLLISGAVICVLAYRPLTTLLRQIPSRNEDFNAFLAEHEPARSSSISAEPPRHGRRLATEKSVHDGIPDIIRTGNP